VRGGQVAEAVLEIGRRGDDPAVSVPAPDSDPVHSDAMPTTLLRALLAAASPPPRSPSTPTSCSRG
jgi:hypothetical protein